MKKKEKRQYEEMDIKELQKQCADLEKKVTVFLMNRYAKQPKNTREGRIMKRKIAFIKTVIRQKEFLHEK